MLDALYKNHLKKAVVLSTVGGVASTKPALIRYFDTCVPAIGMITTKSFQVQPNPGNREPVITSYSPGCFGNSVGLRNPGLKIALSQIKELRASDLRCLLNISLSGSSSDDFVTLVDAFGPYADSLELNFSCPHAASGYGAAIGSSLEISRDIVLRMRERCKGLKAALLIKLTPNVDNIDEIALAVIQAGADGIVAINTVKPLVYTKDNHPILNNGLGGKGGQSGTNVFPIALDAISRIRKAIGDEPIIIGEGGVSSGLDAAELINAGADVVGIGSALAMVRQEKWPCFLDCIKKEALSALSGEKVSYTSRSFLDTTNRMEYIRHTVLDVLHHDSDTVILTLDGTIDSQAGQFLFLWIPGAGEKPFSVATTKPFRLVIKRRGFFTSECMKLKAGDEVYIRGLYGKAFEPLDKRYAILLAGGTGEAVLPQLAEKLFSMGALINSYVGVTSANGGTLEKELSVYGSYCCVSDDGVPGRVIGTINVNDLENTGIYIVGPEPFMAKAAEHMLNLGVPSSAIMVSMEKNTMCGIGMCGECECAGRLTCQWGTFLSYDFLTAEGLL